MPIYEVVTFTPTDEYLANPAGQSSTIGTELMLKQPGLIRPLYYAIQHEDKSTAYMFVGWESIQHHMDLAKSPDYGTIVAEFAKITKEHHGWQHIDFNEAPDAALSAPATEIAIIKLKEGTTKDGFFEVYNQLIDNLKKEPKESLHAISWGESVENKGTYVLLIGWSSVQAHIDAVSKAPFTEIISGIHNLTDVTLKHAAFSTYGKN